MSQATAYNPGRFFALASVIIAAVIAVDQYTKWLVLETMLRQKGDQSSFINWFTTMRPVAQFLDQQENYNKVTFNPWLDFVMVWNKGVSFGMFDSGNPTTTMLLIGFSLCVCMALLVWLVLARSKLLSVALPLMIGGALGNTIDRIRFSC